MENNILKYLYDNETSGYVNLTDYFIKLYPKFDAAILKYVKDLLRMQKFQKSIDSSLQIMVRKISSDASSHKDTKSLSK